MRLYTLSNLPRAWNSIGYMYYYGYGVEKNVKRAYDLFQSKNNFNYIIFRGD